MTSWEFFAVVVTVGCGAAILTWLAHQLTSRQETKRELRDQPDAGSAADISSFDSENSASSELPIGETYASLSPHAESREELPDPSYAPSDIRHLVETPASEHDRNISANLTAPDDSPLSETQALAPGLPDERFASPTVEPPAFSLIDGLPRDPIETTIASDEISNTASPTLSDTQVHSDSPTPQTSIEPFVGPSKLGSVVPTLVDSESSPSPVSTNPEVQAHEQIPAGLTETPLKRELVESDRFGISDTPDAGIPSSPKPVTSIQSTAHNDENLEPHAIAAQVPVEQVAGQDGTPKPSEEPQDTGLPDSRQYRGDSTEPQTGSLESDSQTPVLGEGFLAPVVTPAADTESVPVISETGLSEDSHAVEAHQAETAPAASSSSGAIGATEFANQAELPRTDRRTRDADVPAKFKHYPRKQPPKRITDPIAKGGKPRAPGGLSPTVVPVQTPKEPTEPKRKQGRIDIVCYKADGIWRLSVELSDEWLDGGKPEVLQDGQHLAKDEAEGREVWCLSSLAPVAVKAASGSTQEREILSSVAVHKVLIFKLVGGNLDRGRLVRAQSPGSYLVCAPDSWKLAKTTGRVPREREPVNLKRYVAHFLDAGDSGAELDFVTSTNESITVSISNRELRFVGNLIPDARTKVPPLFAPLPPDLRAESAEYWSRVSCIVLGVEGGGKNAWRKAFVPVADKADQRLTPLLKRDGGWYFARIYDLDSVLIESFDFRFIRGLNSIDILQGPPLPAPLGHPQAEIVFDHDSICQVIVPQVEGVPSLRVLREGARTRTTLPADPIFDMLVFQIKRNLESVSTLISLSRVWWALGQVSCIPKTGWKDRPIDIPGVDITATSTAAIWLRVPVLGMLGDLDIGFSEGFRRRLGDQKGAPALQVPLRELSDDPALYRTKNPVELTLQLWSAGVSIHALVGRVTAPPIPPDLAPPIREPANPTPTSPEFDPIYPGETIEIISGEMPGPLGVVTGFRAHGREAYVALETGVRVVVPRESIRYSFFNSL